MKKVTFEPPAQLPKKIEIIKSPMKGWKYYVTYIYGGTIRHYEYVNTLEDMSVKELGE